MNKIQTTLTSWHFEYLKRLVMKDNELIGSDQDLLNLMYDELCNVQNEIEDQEIMKANSERRASIWKRIKN